MRHHRPARRELLLATATFGAIALGTLLALDLLVTGGFEIAPPRTHPTYYTPMLARSAPVAPMEADGDVAAVGWTQASPIDPEQTEPNDAQGEPQEIAQGEDTLGGDSALSSVDAPSDDDVYRGIEALFAAQDARARQDAARDDQGTDAQAPGEAASPALDGEGTDAADPSESPQ
jgi:hypothetical protein